MKYRLIFVICCLMLFVRCYNEDALVSSGIAELKYTLPQGNHDYDDKIMDWFERCGFYILYKFEPKDVYWNLKDWQELEKDTIWKTYHGINAVPAEEAYAGKLLDVVERRFLNFYPDTMLRRCMTMKLLLCSKLEVGAGSGVSARSFRTGFDYLAVNYGSEQIEQLTPHQIDLLKDTMHLSFLARLTANKKIEMSEEFLAISDYKKKPIIDTVQYSLGFLSKSSGEKSKDDDWEEFVKAIVKNPYEYLTAEPKDKDYRTFQGILHEKKDVKKKIRQKYDILIRYFKEAYGIDLQAIGNSKEPVRE